MIKKFKSEKYGKIAVSEAALISGRTVSCINSRLRYCNDNIDVAMDDDYWRRRQTMKRRPYICRGIDMNTTMLSKFLKYSKPSMALWMTHYKKGLISFEDVVKGIKAGLPAPRVNPNGSRVNIGASNPTDEWMNLGKEKSSKKLLNIKQPTSYEANL